MTQALLPDTDPGLTFETQRRRLEERRKRIAQQVAQGYAQPEGRMVGNTYIRPSWSEHLAPAIRQAIDLYEQKKVDEEQGAYDARHQQAVADYLKKIPQETQVQVQLPGPTESGDALTGTKTVTPTKQEKLDYYAKGTQIPGVRDLVSKQVEDLLLNEPVREEARQYKREDREDRQGEARDKLRQDLEFKAEQLKQEMKRYDLDRATKEQLAKQHDQVLGLIAHIGYQGRVDSAQITADARRDAAQNKPMSDKARAELDAYDASKQGLDQAVSALDKASDKGTGYIAGLVQEKFPGGQSLVAKYRDKGTNDAVQQLTYWTDEIRHGRFGAALTAPEKASAAQYLPSEYDDLAALKRKASGLQNLLDLNHRRLRGAPSEGGATGNWASPPAASGQRLSYPTATNSSNTQVRSQSDVDKLPKGSKFVWTDGKTYTKE